ncbi:muscleblind-like protein 1 [Onthophagus taurus]|uniref:muscleblind-like protein 1 n=1 Tax=Onthophagus taurus TaxID=166361 RepID=UPI0039BE4CBB
MAMVNMNNLLNGKDSRWLQLEVCREFQRNKCSRPDTECKFAHPPANVEVQNGRVTACYDSIKGRCNREKPPCKYFHPPQHLKDQLLINGRNHLALKNALMQQMGLTPGQPLVPGQVPAVVDPSSDCLPLTLLPYLSMSVDEQYALMAANPYLTGMPQVGSTYSPYFAPGHIMPTIMAPDPTGVTSPLGVVPQTVVAQQKMPRSDRLEVCREFQRGACKRAESECRFAHPADTVTANEDGTVTVCMDAVKGRCNRDPCRYFHPPLHLQAQIKAAQSRATAASAAVSPLLAAAPVPAPGPATVEIGKKRPRETSTADADLLLMDMKSVGSFYYDNFAFPGMMPYKRPAGDKSGVPVYQPNATTYQQLMQLQHQPFVPVSCEYTATPNLQIPATSSSSPSTAADAQSPQQVNAALNSMASINTMNSMASMNTMNTMNTINSMSSINSLNTTSSIPNVTDAATIAKEVAHQSYAKAVKLAAAAAANQTLTVGNPLTSHLNPLNYTGVALNKQTLTLPAVTQRYPGTAIPMPAAAAAAAASVGMGLALNPYAAALSQANLLNMGRPPQAFHINPYVLRNSYPGAAAASAAAAAAAAAQLHAAPQLLTPGLIAASQYQSAAAVSTPISNVGAPTANISAVQNNNNNNNNNNVVLPPYKKLKTDNF